MGNWFCRTQEMKVLILGLDGVGKTTLLYHMNLGEVIIPIPTIGYNHEILKIDGVSLTTWDVGSRDKFRPMWRHFYPGTRGIIFVIDCTDRERLGEAMEELCNVLNSEETKNSVFMVMANKQDLEDSMTAQEVEDELLRRFPFLTRLSQSIFVMPFSAFDKSQVMEAFSYFAHLVLLNGAGKA